VQKLPLKSYRDLIAWQRAMRLVELVLPMSRRIGSSPAGLANQMERAAISVPANIAEGYGRGSRAEYLHFLSVAAGSLRELETHILIAQQNGIVAIDLAAEALAVADETGRVLHALRKSLAPKEKKPPRWPG